MTKGSGEIAGDGWVEDLVIIFLYYLYCFIAVIKPDNLAFQKKKIPVHQDFSRLKQPQLKWAFLSLTAV